MSSDRPGEVLFEYMPVGNSMRINAVDVASGTEVTVQAPLTLSPSDMQRLALNKLVYVMGKEKK